MRSVNRSAVIVRPAQPFLDWLHQVDPTSAELTLEDLRSDPSVYLLPVYDTEEQARNHLRKRCEDIFEEQLEGWYRDPSTWPVSGTLAPLAAGSIGNFTPACSISAQKPPSTIRTIDRILKSVRILGHYEIGIAVRAITPAIAQALNLSALRSC
jgi:hypothetical protein